MTSLASPITNFSHLREHDEQLLRLGLLAERYFADDPNTCILKLRQLAELLARLAAARTGLFESARESQYDRLRRLRDRGILPREIAQLFGEIRRAGNAANHSLAGDHSAALSTLKIAWQLGLWFHRTFGDPSFECGSFVPPSDPMEESEEERSFREQIAIEEKLARARFEQRIEDLQSTAATQPKDLIAQYITASGTAASSLQLDEVETRKLIDAQLRQAGWTADSATITHGRGARPEKGRNLAIAEWPTSSGPADYVLFLGLTPVATVEAKRKHLDVSAAIQQAKRYSRDFELPADLQSPGGPWGDHRIPFVLSSNGRPYLRQLATRSGIWFCDVRRPNNLARALDGWYTPEGLTALLKRDEARSHEHLAAEPLRYDFQLRLYQEEAIRAVESRIEEGRREMLVAMATGTGKTKTCIALIYRLLKARRFSRVLFLVDRSALGEQAANAFKDTRMENFQTFADVFGIKELEDTTPDRDTAVHIATIQGMVKRILYTDEEETPPPIDRYDCIVVDECHRGYLLDRELSEDELSFRSFDDYISKYRRVLETFDAIKIGLTATPALHTTEIFGPPVFTYSYREAVIDGFLIDHEPPVQIRTERSEYGITWEAGEEVKVYDAGRNRIDLFTAPDEIKIDVEGFNRKVITEPFNRVVCEHLALELDPESRQKTLIFCANDAHADLVVALLKNSFAAQYGTVEDDAVLKITGNSDNPLRLIRRYKNERNPSVAVTVDLLTTGIDVPEICNLVFLRRVGSRILYDQMLGRATRPCDEIGKETFRIFDAVRIYEALRSLTDMRPVVVNPAITFSQLTRELASVAGDEERALVRDQFLAKLQRKKHTLEETQRRDFKTVAGTSPDAFIRQLREMPMAHIADWFARNPALGEILDRKGGGSFGPLFISEHEDRFIDAQRGYGTATRPEDYLKGFSDFIRQRSNTLPALITVLTRPRDLTRKQLRELAMELDRAGFSEACLATAWREMTNQDIAARIVGYIRQAAIGDALIPYEQRVDSALRKILASRKWTAPQHQWLRKIAAQTKANLLVDREALDDPDLIFRREGGGFPRLNRIFEGQLEQVLQTFNDSLWQNPAA